MQLSEVPNSPEHDFGLFLEGDKIGSIGKKRGWAIYFGFDPDSPKNLISISSTSSIMPMSPINQVGPDNDTGLVEYPQLGVRVLSATYEDGYKKSYQIMSAFRNRVDLSGEYWKYLNFKALGVPLYLGQDDKGRHVFSTDYFSVRTPIVEGASESASPSPS